MAIEINALYYGDNLNILRKYIPDNSIDLIYLDPPFNSSATYNVLFKEPGGESSQAQISAFEDTWHWGPEAALALQEIAASPIAPNATKDFMSVLQNLVGKRTDMSAYLAMMCIRLIELRRVLKAIGSLYLHCDPTASHYLKVMLDTIFGNQNFNNEIIWKRTSAHNDSGVFGDAHDIIFYYSKTDKFINNKQYQSYNKNYIDSHYRFKDENGRLFRTGDLTALGLSGGGYTYEWHGINTIWRYPIERMRELEANGRIRYTKSGMAEYIRYLDEMPGMPVQDIWDDIPPINSQAREHMGYPTQKPEALLERIIRTSSNEGDIVLDPFCGCGTALVASQNLNRKWIGIDITHLAIGLMKWRLNNLTPPAKFVIHGEPKDLAGAVELANQDKYQFQWWVVSQVGGQPYGERKKGTDTGIDGYLYYMDVKDKIKKAIISVKGGHNTNVSMIRDLGHVIDREKSDIGIFITLDKPSRPMTVEAAMKGFYHSPLGKDYPRLQIFTIEEILQGKMPELPPWIAPVPTASPNKKKESQANKLL